MVATLILKKKARPGPSSQSGRHLAWSEASGIILERRGPGAFRPSLLTLVIVPISSQPRRRKS
ncbi:MAG: hypothetical protein AMR96_05985 [Candidatus Adiutrix intracellularis]|nr:MAG: hypothetical protein AMR96_05985 [Candidatus Adiutrix intracellularis]MDR2827559.1 hypothetical protein [Candidatus Adiutrix intracellularis]